MTGVSGSSRKPRDMIRTPYRSKGWILPSTISGRRSMPNIRGMDGP